MKKFLINNKNVTKIVMIMSAVASLTGALFFGFLLDKVIESHDEEMMKFIAADIFDDINKELLKPVMIVRIISSDTYLKEKLKREGTLPFNENVAIMQEYLSDIQQNFKCTSAYVVSDASKIYYTYKGFHKIVDVENDAHDIWYKLFVDGKHSYEFDIDVDETNKNNWTIFVSGRIEDEDRKLLGVCGVGIDLTSLQNLFITTEQSCNVKINLVDPKGIVQVDTNSVNIERAHSQNFVNPNRSAQFVFAERNGIYTVTKYIPDLGWYLMVSRSAEFLEGEFTNLIFYTLFGFIVASAISLIVIKSALNAGYERIEENAKKSGLASYADLYTSTHLIDLQENSIHEISNNPKYELFYTYGTENAAYQLSHSVKEMVVSENLNAMLEFVKLDTIAARLKEKRVIYQEFRSKNYGWCKAYFITIGYDKNQNIREIIFAIELIDAEKKRENELRYLSQTDLMTGLRNRGSGEKAMQDLMSNGVEGMFCLMDADKFKSINDNYGHDVGDKVIKAIAECLKKSFRSVDITMRLGGDEFAAYVTGVTGEPYGKTIIEKFFDEINTIEIPELGDRKISISLGAAFFTVGENLSFAEVYKRADSSAYESKKTSGNFYTFYK